MSSAATTYTAHQHPLLHKMGLVHQRLLEVGLALTPMLLIGYLQIHQNSPYIYKNIELHSLFSVLIVGLGGFASFITWRCYIYSGERPLYWLTTGLLGLACIYLFRLCIVLLFEDAAWAFFLHGPISRLILGLMILASVLSYQRRDKPTIKVQSKYFFINRIVIFFLLNSLIYYTVSEQTILSVNQLRAVTEQLTLLVYIIVAGVLFFIRQDSYNLKAIAIASILFAQTSVAFVFAQNWDHYWWLGQVILICGVVFVSHSITGIFLTSCSFEKSFSQEELFQRLVKNNLELSELLEQARVSEQRFRDTFNFAPIGMAIVQPNGKIVEVNASFCRMIKYDKEKLINLNFQEITYTEDLGKDLELLNQLLNGEIDSYLLEKRYIDSENKVIWGKLGVSLIRDIQGMPLYCIAQVVDITSLKETEQALLNSNHDLEQFAYIASHDLQEPLRKIRSFAQLFARTYQQQVDATGQTYIKFVIDGSQRLQELINDILTYSRIGRDKVAHTVVDLNQVLKQVLFDLELLISEAHAHVEYQALPKVLANEAQMCALLQNLLSNALKYRGAVAPFISISYEIDSTRSHVTVCVKDNGIGINPRYWERIFVIFQRLHNHDQYPGTGIGLAICKKIIESHAGKIWVESQPNQGACFYFTLTLSNR